MSVTGRAEPAESSIAYKSPQVMHQVAYLHESRSIRDGRVQQLHPLQMRQRKITTILEEIPEGVFGLGKQPGDSTRRARALKKADNNSVVASGKGEAVGEFRGGGDRDGLVPCLPSGESMTRLNPVLVETEYLDAPQHAIPRDIAVKLGTKGRRVIELQPEINTDHGWVEGFFLALKQVALSLGRMSSRD